MQLGAADANKFIWMPRWCSFTRFCDAANDLFAERIDRKSMCADRKTVGEGCLCDVVPAQEGVDAPQPLTITCQYDIQQLVFSPELNARNRMYALLFASAYKLGNGRTIVDVGQCQLSDTTSQCRIHELLWRQGAVTQTVICMTV